MTADQKKHLPTGNHDSPSRFDSLIFLLLAAMPVIAVVLFGAVDVWALGFFTILTGLLTVFWAVLGWREKQLTISFNLLQIPLIGLILLGLFQILPLRQYAAPDSLSIPAVSSLSLAAYATRFAIIQLVIYLIFFAAALVFINHRKRLKKIVWTLVILGAAMAFFGILQKIAGGGDVIYGIRQAKQANPFASYINQHHFAALMEMTGGVALGLLFGGAVEKTKRLLVWFAVTIMGIALLFTSSRGGMISFLVVLLFVAAFKFKSYRTEIAARYKSEEAGRDKWRKIQIIGSVVIFIGLMIISLILLGGEQSLVRGIETINQADASNGRFHFWSVALKIFAAYPIFGAGLDAFGTAFTQFDTWNGTFRIEQAHNDYLQILADGGIVGFILVAAFIFLLFRQSWRNVARMSEGFGRAAAVGALAGCAGILFHSFFDFPLRTPANALVFLILVALTQVQIPTSKVKSSRQRKTN